MDCSLILCAKSEASSLTNSGMKELIFSLLTILPILFFIQSLFFSTGTVKAVFITFLKLFITPSDSLNEVDTCLPHSAKLLLLKPILLLIPSKSV